MGGDWDSGRWLDIRGVCHVPWQSYTRLGADLVLERPCPTSPAAGSERSWHSEAPAGSVRRSSSRMSAGAHGLGVLERRMARSGRRGARRTVGAAPSLTRRVCVLPNHERSSQRVGDATPGWDYRPASRRSRPARSAKLISSTFTSGTPAKPASGASCFSARIFSISPRTPAGSSFVFWAQASATRSS